MDSVYDIHCCSTYIIMYDYGLATGDVLRRFAQIYGTECFSPTRRRAVLQIGQFCSTEVCPNGVAVCHCSG